MSTTLREKMQRLPRERQAKIQSRTNELIAEELTLRDLRKALKLTQIEMARKLRMKQESISRLERRSDILLSTLINYINAMGGDLKLTAEFPNRKPIIIHGFSDIQENRHYDEVQK